MNGDCQCGHCVVNSDCVSVDVAIEMVIMSVWRLRYEQLLFQRGCCGLKSYCVSVDVAV